MTKKYIFILFFIFLLVLLAITFKNETLTNVFNEVNSDNDFDNYVLEFEECVLSTDNFIEKFSYFNNKDYKVLSITPYINESYKELFNDIKFNYYSNNLEDILISFKEKYLNVINSENYIKNICIKNIKINTANIYLNEFKTIIPFNNY